MKFIAAREFRTSPAKIWRELSIEQEMIVTNNGKPIALLTPLSDVTLEDTLSALRKAKAVNGVRLMQQKSINLQNNEMTSEDIVKEIQETRAQSKK